MKKSCLNCELYKKIKGKTELGDIYSCFPEASLGLKKERLGNYSCNM